MIGDEDPAVSVDLEPVGLAVVLGDLFGTAVRRDAEDPTVGDVHDVEVPRTVERRALEKLGVGDAREHAALDDSG